MDNTARSSIGLETSVNEVKAIKVYIRIVGTSPGLRESHHIASAFTDFSTSLANHHFVNARSPAVLRFETSQGRSLVSKLSKFTVGV